MGQKNYDYIEYDQLIKTFAQFCSLKLESKELKLLRRPSGGWKHSQIKAESRHFNLTVSLQIQRAQH